jgi:hypothetical protein
MTHHAGPPAQEKHRAPLTTGRLFMWLCFGTFWAIMLMGTVVQIVKGAP